MENFKRRAFLAGVTVGAVDAAWELSGRPGIVRLLDGLLTSEPDLDTILQTTSDPLINTDTGLIERELGKWDSWIIEYLDPAHSDDPSKVGFVIQDQEFTKEDLDNQFLIWTAGEHSALDTGK